MGHLHANGRPFPVTPQAPVCPWQTLEVNKNPTIAPRLPHTTSAAPTATDVATGATGAPQQAENAPAGTRHGRAVSGSGRTTPPRGS